MRFFRSPSVLAIAALLAFVAYWQSGRDADPEAFVEDGRQIRFRTYDIQARQVTHMDEAAKTEPMQPQ